MMREDTDPRVVWEDGDLPVSTRFNDPYYSRTDGLAEARHVFLAGNDLPDRWPVQRAFQIAELGFGTGLNCLAAAALWRRQATGEATLNYTTFEAYPMRPEEMAKALRHWPEMQDLAGRLVQNADRFTFELLPGINVQIVPGDARRTLPQWDGAADAWFLDGFAPARNPELWEPDLMQAVFDWTRPGGTFATYSAAGHVRRSLTTAGFTVSRVPGFGTKREMLTGRRDPSGTQQ